MAEVGNETKLIIRLARAAVEQYWRRESRYLGGHNEEWRQGWKEGAGQFYQTLQDIAGQLPGAHHRVLLTSDEKDELDLPM